jgi:hypothetical protein
MIIKIQENSQGCTITLIKDLKDSTKDEQIKIDSKPELIALDFSRDDISVRVQSFPLQGPLHEFSWVNPENKTFLIFFNIYKCRYDYDEF